MEASIYPLYQSDVLPLSTYCTTQICCSLYRHKTLRYGGLYFVGKGVSYGGVYIVISARHGGVYVVIISARHGGVYVVMKPVKYGFQYTVTTPVNVVLCIEIFAGRYAGIYNYIAKKPVRCCGPYIHIYIYIYIYIYMEATKNQLYQSGMGALYNIIISGTTALNRALASLTGFMIVRVGIISSTINLF
jgi:hypothetical protein